MAMVCYILNLTVKFISHGQFPIHELKFKLKLVLNMKNSVDSVYHRHAELTRICLKLSKFSMGLLDLAKVVIDSKNLRIICKSIK